MNSTLKAWLHGLLGAAIGAIGTAIPLVIVAPQNFNFSGPGLIQLAKACGASALLAAGLYLKTSPLPPD